MENAWEWVVMKQWIAVLSEWGWMKIVIEWSVWSTLLLVNAVVVEEAACFVVTMRRHMRQGIGILAGGIKPYSEL